MAKLYTAMRLLFWIHRTIVNARFGSMNLYFGMDTGESLEAHKPIGEMYTTL